jgi:phosphinothricin acetyltransferase
MELHKKFGFAEVGVYQKTGYKFGQWWDLLVMEKRLREPDMSPIPPKSVHEVSVK